MSFRDRLQWFARMALLVFILAATAFLSSITAMRFAIQGREVEVPNLVGKKTGDAQAMLAGRRLGMKVADRVYSELPVDHVVRQSPPSGTRVKVAQRVHVLLSLGPRQVSIPSLVDKSPRAARIELLRAGLQVGEISNCYLLGQEPDRVVQQDPPARATDLGSPRVNLLVSLGPREPAYVMPDLAGLSLADAQRRLSTAGLRLAKITFTPSPEIPSGTVFARSPPPGTRIPAGTVVELQVAE